jgi:transcriptional regulator with XRE-family HTH domain
MKEKVNFSDEVKGIYNSYRAGSIDFESKLNSLRFMGELQKVMDGLSINSQECAKILGVSSSYLSQLFYGTRKVNMDFMTKAALKFNMKLETKLCSKNHELIEFKKSARRPLMYWSIYGRRESNISDNLLSVSPSERERQIA